MLQKLCRNCNKIVHKKFYDNSNYIVTCRAGNVIGGGDFSDHRLIPDIVKSYFKKKEISIRSLNSTRPWQHVLEPIFAYLLVAKKIKKKKLITKHLILVQIVKILKKLDLLFNKLKKVEHKVKKSKLRFKESKLLSLNCKKAKKTLNWKPV